MGAYCDGVLIMKVNKKVRREKNKSGWYIATNIVYPNPITNKYDPLIVATDNLGRAEQMYGERGNPRTGMLINYFKVVVF